VKRARGLAARVAELERIVAEQGRTIAALQAPAAPHRQALDLQLVTALTQAGFRDAFRAAQACAARRDEPALDQAMSDRLIDGPQSMGRALERLAKAGRVERLGDDGRGALWRVRRSVDGDSGDSGDAGCHSVAESRP
jgi:uncharacterized coiled-coil protein SlyX